MNRDSLYELADKIKALLIENGIAVEAFSLGIRVSKTTYDSFKDGFPDRHPVDRVFGVAEGNDWSISIMYSPYQANDEGK
ncbi:MAG: hypothetical protein KJ065_12880 [Anaerolineae bacterium]|nr:hypothetical protein [Anaerolineae bacterium]